MGYIVHLDDDRKVIENCEHLYSQYDLSLELRSFTSISDFRGFIHSNRSQIRSLIFDLADDDVHDTLAFSSEITEKYAKYNVPIFIYSGHLVKYSDFEECGTIFKIDKGDDGFKFIIDKIKIFEDSGFLNIFCPGGIIENEIHKDLNEAFTKQFQNNNDIEEIISSLEGEGDVLKKRTTNVFRRIALRSLMSKLLAPEEGQYLTVNASEHYLRRLSNFEYWAGDIFTKKDSNPILILTPRCNCANAKTINILICDIIKDTFPKAGKDIKEKIRKALTDNPNLSGHTVRYLPPSPLFQGGNVDLSTTRTILKSELDEYTLQISLSDDLTNEILGKLASYFMRTGISTIDVEEMIKYIYSLKE